MKITFAWLLFVCGTPRNLGLLVAFRRSQRNSLSVHAILGLGGDSSDDAVSAAALRAQLRAKTRAEASMRAKEERAAKMKNAAALRESEKAAKAAKAIQVCDGVFDSERGEQQNEEAKQSTNQEEMISAEETMVTSLQAKTFDFLKKRGVIGKNAKARVATPTSGGGMEGGGGRTEGEDYSFAKKSGEQVADVLRTAMSEFGEGERAEKRLLKLKALANPLSEEERSRLQALVIANQEQQQALVRKKGPIMVKTRLAFRTPNITGTVDSLRESFPMTTSGTKWVLSTDASVNVSSSGSSSGSKGGSTARMFRTTFLWRTKSMDADDKNAHGGANDKEAAGVADEKDTERAVAFGREIDRDRPCNVLLGRVSSECRPRDDDGSGDDSSSSSRNEDEDDDESGCDVQREEEEAGLRWPPFVQMSVALSNEQPEGVGTVDCSRFDGVELDVFCPRGETYNVHLRTETCVQAFSAYRASFQTEARHFSTVRVPWHEFVGHGVDGVALDPSKLKRIGLLGFGRDFHCELAVAGVRFFAVDDTDNANGGGGGDGDGL